MTDQPFRIEIDKLGADGRRRLETAIRDSVPRVAPALAVSVWSAGSPWFEAYAGFADAESHSHPVGFATLFDLASVSKVFTATAFLRLASDFKVDLDDPIVGIIPEFGEGGERGLDGGQEPLTRDPIDTPAERVAWTVDPGTVTFRQLLTHTSGLAPWRSVFGETGTAPPAPDQQDPHGPADRLSRALTAISAYPFVARPGVEVRYSDLGYMLLGIAVARLFRAPLEVSMQALLRDRIGIDSLTYTPVQVGRPQQQTAQTSVDEEWRQRRCWGEVEDENAAGMGGVAGHAGLFSSAHDLARFGVAWLRHDPRLRMERFSKQAVVNQTADMGIARGLGWLVQPTDYLEPFGEATYGHPGFTGTSLVVDPERDLVISLLTNRVWAGRTHEGIEALRLEIHEAVVAAL